MRKATGDRLFVRFANGMAPTTYAQRIAGAIRQSLATIHSYLTEHQGFDAAGSDRSFVLYLTDLGEALFPPRLLARIGRNAPKVRICTLPMPPEAARAALKSGKMDLAAGNLPDFQADQCWHERFHDDAGNRWLGRQFAELFIS